MDQNGSKNNKKNDKNESFKYIRIKLPKEIFKELNEIAEKSYTDAKQYARELLIKHVLELRKLNKQNQ